MSDYRNGRTDRVVWEYEVDNLGEIDARFDRVMADLRGQTTMKAWFQKLTELIHYAEVETWTVR